MYSLGSYVTMPVDLEGSQSLLILLAVSFTTGSPTDLM